MEQKLDKVDFELSNYETVKVSKTFINQHPDIKFKGNFTEDTICILQCQPMPGMEEQFAKQCGRTWDKDMRVWIVRGYNAFKCRRWMPSVYGNRGVTYRDIEQLFINEIGTDHISKK